MLAGAEDGFIVKIADPPCPEEVTKHVDIIRLPFHRVFFGLLWFQRVIIHNKTSAPIIGPLALVMDDLRNAVFIGSPLKTSCFSSSEDPFLIVPAGDDDVLAANESVLTVLWFAATPFDHIVYAPRLVSGVPPQ